MKLNRLITILSSILVILSMIIWIGCASPSDDDQSSDKVEPETVTDIDGNVYNTVKIGEQLWLVENLKVTHYRNGDSISDVSDDAEWQGLNTGAYGIYDDQNINATTYGMLYNWHAVGDSRQLAPEDWHVATDEDWKELEMYLGMSQSQADEIGITDRGTDEGDKLKEVGTDHWSPNVNATDEVGFTALPGGYRYDTGAYFLKGQGTRFWTSTETSSTSAKARFLGANHSKSRRYDQNKLFGHSVRCVWD